MQGVFVIAIWLYGLASMLTHVVSCISDDRWGMLFAGALIPPVGIIHGTGIWFGWF